MTFTTEEYEALRSAYVQGVVRVKYADKEVTYRSLAEMKAILDQMEASLGTKPRWDGRLLAKHSKGT